MHFALRGYLFVALTALLGVAGTWSDVPAFAGAWLLPAFLLLLGLAFEAFYLRGTQVTVAMRYDERLKLGRQVLAGAPPRLPAGAPHSGPSPSRRNRRASAAGAVGAEPDGLLLGAAGRDYVAVHWQIRFRFKRANQPS